MLEALDKQNLGPAERCECGLVYFSFFFASVQSFFFVRSRVLIVFQRNILNHWLRFELFKLRFPARCCGEAADGQFG